MHHFATEMYTHVQISVKKWCGALWDMGPVHRGICATVLLDPREYTPVIVLINVYESSSK